jgi:hypothetical protein
MMAICVDSDTGEDVEAAGVTAVKEDVEVVGTVPWEIVEDAGSFCAPASWKIKAAGMIKNLYRIGRVFTNTTQKLCHASEPAPGHKERVFLTYYKNMSLEFMFFIVDVF